MDIEGFKEMKGTETKGTWEKKEKGDEIRGKLICN